MKTLGEIASFINARLTGDADLPIGAITHDSRSVTKDSLFICIEGAHVDGHDYIEAAKEKGAVALLSARKDLTAPEGMSLITVDNLTEATEKLAPYFHDYPAKSMRVIGITGTNGKTTTSYMIKEILSRAGFKVGLIGTLQIIIDGKTHTAHNTTPDAVELQNILAAMRDAGTDYVVMEVSSHALSLNRIAGINFTVAVFTNLTQDHLDFHKTIENYRKAKEKLFTLLYRDGCAVVNIDDIAGDFMLKNSAASKKRTYGIKKAADLSAAAVNVKPKGARFSLKGKFGSIDISLKVTGLFNVYNALAAAETALAEKVNVGVIKVALENFGGVPGRFEAVWAGQKFPVIVDYAHTPDGMENVLCTARQIVEGKIITVFGCGGDRDPIKRPIMGRLAADLSDVVIATSDNPRSEDPLKILEAVEEGVKEKIGAKHHELIADRKQAIFRAMELASNEDIVMILGKGHEDYQILKDETIHFDDREVAREALKNLRG